MPERDYIPVMSSSRRKYELFPGNMQFPCDGRMTMAKQTGVLKMTVFLIVVSSGLFFGFDVPYLSKHVSPVVPVVAAMLFLLSMALLLRTALMDPGVLPRARGHEAAFNELGAKSQAEGESNSGGSDYTAPPRVKTVLIRGQEVTIKYCFTCRMFREPRSSHCSLCDACIENFDHHCPWVGNCVGRRNYRYFYLFLFSLTLYCLCVFAGVIYHIVMLAKEPNASLTSAIGDSPASLIVAIICFFSIWSVLGLCGFHTALIAQAITTNEDIKGTYNSRNNVENPYDHGGYMNNVVYTLCSPIPQSLLARREFVQDEEEAAEAAITQTIPGQAARATMALIGRSQTTATMTSAQSDNDRTEESKLLVSP